MKRIEFGKYAGVRMLGKTLIEPIDPTWHLDRAEWLIAMVESGGKYGSVHNYDGTGMTAGLHQAIAVLPKSRKQGTLWGLLGTIRSSTVGRSIGLLEALVDAGYSLRGGFLVHAGSRELVPFEEIRDQFSGSADGYVPKEGVHRLRAEKWVRLFHNCLSNPVTFPAQRFEGKDWCKTQVRRALSASSAYSELRVSDLLYDSEPLAGVTWERIGMARDLALSVFWAYSVNAPTKALKILCRTVDAFDPREESLDFAMALVRRFARSTFGRWHYTRRNGRYQRTRLAAMRGWPVDLFEGADAIMPAEF